ncbi:MAG: hypothetical protein ACUVSQ_06665 [Pseudanabaenaceae cyanobacterium]
MSRRVWVRVWVLAAIGALLPLGCGDTRLVQCRQLIEAVAPAANLSLTVSPTAAPAPATETAPNAANPSPTASSAAPLPETPNADSNRSTNLAATADRLEALALSVRSLTLGDRTLRDLQTRFDTYFSDSSRLLRDFVQAQSNPLPSALERLRQQAEDLQAREATLTAETNRYCAQ